MWADFVASATEAILGGLALVAAVLYFFVARLQAQRKVSAEARGPLRGFIIWWAGLGLLGLTTALFTFGPGTGSFGLAGARAITYTTFAGIFVMLSGLVYYLLYLYTGSRGTVYVAAAFYSLLFLFMVWLVEAHAPHVGADHITGERAFHLHEAPPAWASLGFGVSLVLPPLAAAVAYFLLFFRTHDRTARYRIAMVSGGLVLWLGFSLMGTIARTATGESQGFGGQLTSQLLGVLSATLVLLAYDPPKFVQRRLGLRPIEASQTDRSDIFRMPPRLACASRHSPERQAG